MKTPNVLILSIEEVKEKLIQYTVEVLIDPKNSRKMLEDGTITNIPNFVSIKAEQLIEHFHEELAEIIAKRMKVNLILVQTDESHYTTVYDIENTPLEKRHLHTP